MSTPEPSFSSFEEFFALYLREPSDQPADALGRRSSRRQHGRLCCDVAQVHRPVHVGAVLVLKDDGGAVALVPVPWPLGDSARK